MGGSALSRTSSTQSIGSLQEKRISQRKLKEMEASPQSPKKSERKSLTADIGNPAVPLVQVSMSPQGYLDSMLRSRGYSTQKHKTLESSYYNKPTPLQLASYHANLVTLLREHKEDKVRSLISCGLSPNPCNQHGESVVHSICRRNDYHMLQLLIRLGASVQVSDDQGRTPLHEACWGATLSFATVDVVLQQDPRLIHMVDARGATPLSFVRSENWPAWLKFLRSRIDLYWPLREAEDGLEGVPERTLQPPNTCPLPDPEAALTTELAAMVAAGRISPEEAEFLMIDDGEDDGTLMDDDDDSDYDDSDFTDSEFDDSEGDFSCSIMESNESIDLEAVLEAAEEEEPERVSEASNSTRDFSSCPGGAAISNYSTDESHHDEEEDEGGESEDEFFGETDIESLIQGITSGKEIAWSK